jgi:hypothetical protein
MPRPIVIIHGWSDKSKSFKPLAQKIRKKLNRPVKTINLVDYESMDDEVTFDDLVAAMATEWKKKKLPTTPHSVDVILHSTGGLVVRHWLQNQYSSSTAPIKNLVMLAPANFGSPLGHKGTTFIGRIIKGWSGDKLFQVGEKLLQGLELASPYTWNLAMQDRFGRESFFGKNKILCTVLVGNAGYSGIAAAANEAGSDGTVRVSTANLNCARISADFSEDPLKPEIAMQSSTGKTAFAVMDGENHGSIVSKNKNKITFERIVGGLTVTDAKFDSWCLKLDAETNAVMTAREQQNNSYYNGYQNTVFLVRDQFCMHVGDYFLEFFDNDENSDWFEEFFHQDVIRTLHAHSEDKAYRSMLIDCTCLMKKIKNHNKFQEMRISLTAKPEFRVNGKVGYQTVTDDDIGAIKVPKGDIPKVLNANRTLFVEIILKRQQAEKVFQIKKL